MRIVSDVVSGNRFYSDLNGFQVLTHSFAFILKDFQSVQSEAFFVVMSRSDKTFDY